jgi:putative membrane protein
LRKSDTGAGSTQAAPETTTLRGLSHLIGVREEASYDTRVADHAANERTFLAWVRTGVAVIAFGFVIEKFNLFLLSLLNTVSLDPTRRSQLERLAGPSARYEGLGLILVGIALLIVAAVRFVRTERLLADPQMHSIAGVRAEVILSAVLALMVAVLGALLAVAG